MKKLVVLFVVTLLAVGCQSGEPKRTYMSSNGRINNVLVIMKNSEWQGAIGDALRKIIAAPVLGLPQPEAQFDITQAPPESYGSMFRATRSLLIVSIENHNSFSTRSNVYAKPQKIVTITGTSEEQIILQIEKNKKEILTSFRDNDLITTQSNNSKNLLDPATINTFNKLGISMSIPKKYKKVEDTDEFMWYRHHLTNGNSMEILAYTMPYDSTMDMSDQIVNNRNTMGEKYIPGSKKGSYMITEEAYTPHVFDVTLAGKKAYETRGKWEVKGAYMAGPFLNYTVLDKANNRLIIVEGFTYAPSINKRDFMFELEAILKTLKIHS
ncbi:MAG: DUF4837 domain-containing protein [Flavobacteriaceae bacterium]|nr:MAG: DUF4837 domain-containing protein [Flavobacteriaceae bacterium]